MLLVENTDVFGWEAALRGMRNPMNSWNQSDSHRCFEDCLDKDDCDEHQCSDIILGENDLKLMKNLAKAGSDHAKYLRMINVTCDITAPLYWWKEFDTYKVGTVANSCSTMHKIHAKEFTLDDFSWDQLLNTGCDLFEVSSDDGLFHTTVQPLHLLIDYIIPALNVCRDKYLECGEALKYNNFETWSDGMACKTAQKSYWWQMIQLLPSSYNQRRTVQLNYEVLRTQRRARKNHKLDCWHTYCDWIDTLPYAKELIIGEE